MARGKSEDTTTLQMALIGYQVERQKIEEKIRELQARLKGKKAAAPATVSEAKTPSRRKRVLSSAARARIAAAQKKRWAEHRKRLAAAGKD